MEKREIDFHGKKLTIEVGRIARQASGAALIRYGDTMLLATACIGDEKTGDFVPLTVDYVEKQYAAGKIPGGFFKREGKLSERETLISRLIDRPCRPLFPEGYRNETQVVVTVLSADEETDTDVLAILGASVALTVSEIPFEGPIAGVRVARIDGKLVINPTSTQLKKADVSFVVAGSEDAIVMVEGGAQEVPEEDVLEALFTAHKEMQPLIALQKEFQKAIGKPKIIIKPKYADHPLEKSIKEFLKEPLSKAVRIAEKQARGEAYSAAKAELKAKFIPEGTENAAQLEPVVSHFFEENLYTIVRELSFKEKRRVDGRDFTTVRPINIEVGLLPRTHGSALFTRGETQAIVVATLATEAEAQKLDNIMGDTTKSFLLHYNFPPFSVGEARPMRGPGRREIGHGALAERAVRAVIPASKQFPYVIRIVSEITESNGSSSMASVCGASLALMEAGVPLKAPVAGVAMGLMKEGKDFVVLTDILGDEDHLGDMDFKVCGTETGITALQMDIKIKGLDKEIVRTALKQAREGRLHILAKMNEAISKPREAISRYAPRIVTLKINPDKIRDVIGPGGKMIRSITESCDVKMEVTDDGTVSIASNDESKVKAAIDMVKSLTAEAEVGKIYQGVVKRIADFGAFVEIIPGTDGLLHISQISEEKIRRVTDVVKEGDIVTVKVLDVDRQGKIRLSMKEAH